MVCWLCFYFLNGLLSCTNFLGLVYFVLSFVKRNTTITTSQKSRATSPSIRSPASKEITSDSVELWDNNVRFLHIQFIGTNVRLPKIHKIPPEVDFDSSRSPAKPESWTKPNQQCWAVLPTWQCSRWSFVWCMYEIKRAERLSQAPVHFVTALASLFTDHATVFASNFFPLW